MGLVHVFEIYTENCEWLLETCWCILLQDHFTGIHMILLGKYAPKIDPHEKHISFL